MTYVREQQVLAWTRNDFDGTVENVAVVPEGTEDAVYLVIKRTIDGSTKRYVERMTKRVIDDLEDLILVDSAHTYDGRNTGSTTMTLSGGTTWEYTETLTLTASVATFESGDVGNEIHLTGSDGEVIRFEIKGFTSSTVVTGTGHKTIPTSLRTTATTTWTEAISTVTGLWHLEGKNVSVFADKFVVASPNNASYTTVAVSDGSVTLDRPYGVIHIGLPFISDVETLDINTAQGETLADKRKNVTAVSMHLEKTRGVWAGNQPPTSDTTDPLENLYELKVRESETYDDPVALFTGVEEIDIESRWNSSGRVFIRQVDPVPLTLLSVYPSGWLPFRG